MMESYKIIREKAMERNNVYETNLLEVTEKKKINYQQYNAILEEGNVLSTQYLEIVNKRKRMVDKKTDILKIIESLFLAALFVLTIGIMGNEILPIIKQLYGEDLGVLFMITGSLTFGVGEILLIGIVDGILTSRIGKKIKRNKKYKKLSEEIEKYKSKMNVKTKEQEKKLEEYNMLVEEEKKLLEQIRSNDSLINLLNSLIEEDEKMDNIKIDNNNLVKKRVKDNN